jgi:SPP1 gp7 family putative phage head morphogenesis protein
MLYNLKRKPRRINVLKAQPRAIELRYFRALRALFQPAFNYILERLSYIMPLRLGFGKRIHRMDAIDDEINNVLQAVKMHLLSGVKDTIGVLDKLAFETAEKQAEALSQAVGIDVTRFSPSTRYMVESFVKENVPLIHSVAEDLLTDVADEINEVFNTGSRWEDLSIALQERFNVTETRANLIARTEIAKLNGQFNQVRQENLGVEEYIWRTVGDERVRESHRILDGTRHRWDKPPAVGHPGADFQCRCMADPVLKELEDAA